MKTPEAALRVADRVENRIERLFEAESQRWTDVSADLAMPLGALRHYVLSGGKRLRPSFSYWAFVGAGGAPDDPAIIDAGAALEMLHTSALVHDDIIDGSASRHGSDTVHVRFAATHASSGWFGASDRFGEGVAILVGDLALVYSSRLMTGAPLPALGVFEEMRLEVNMGQYLDVLGAAEGLDLPHGEAVDRARMICRYKTAKYTIERPLHLGAALAAPDRIDDLLDPLSRFGLPLGEAFQLRDDLLGVFGDPAVTGKPVGDDLREGKATLLAGLAAQRDQRGEDSPLRSRFGRADLSEGEVAEIQKLIESTGARADVEAAISALVEQARQALAELPLTGEAVAALGDLTDFVVGRDH
jgi:geranylgeranyl diphosphate synthase type I